MVSPGAHAGLVKGKKSGRQPTPLKPVKLLKAKRVVNKRGLCQIKCYSTKILSAPQSRALTFCIMVLPSSCALHSCWSSGERSKLFREGSFARRVRA